jgi:O-methyltransferase/methyltransferase family protein
MDVHTVTGPEPGDGSLERRLFIAGGPVSTFQHVAEPLAPAVAAAQQIMQLSTGYILSTALHTAVRLKVADLIGAGHTAMRALAEQTTANEDALYRVLRLLASVGVFEEHAPRHFVNTPASSLLRSDVPGSMYPMALWMADPTHFRVYADANHSVSTGQPAIEKTFGVPVFEYFPRNPELSEIFNNAMTAFSAMVIPAVLETYDFSGIGTLVDVAGGHGGVLTGVLQKYSGMRGVLFDLEHVIAGAVPRIAQLGLAERCRTVSGNFFEAVPEGGDAYIMKHIIHDWDDEQAIAILRNIRRAMNRGGRVILVESIVQPGNQPDFAKIIDLEMLLMPGGRERTEAEFRALFAAAGLEMTRIVATGAPLSVIEAR